MSLGEEELRIEAQKDGHLETGKSPSPSQGERPEKKLTLLISYVQFLDSRFVGKSICVVESPSVWYVLVAVVANTAPGVLCVAFVVRMPGIFLCSEVTLKREHLQRL